MAVNKIFIDSEDNKLNCWVNENSALQIRIRNSQKEAMHIELYREDAEELLKFLHKLVNQLDY